MTTVWKVLVVDTAPADFENLERVLSQTGRLDVCRRVDTLEAFEGECAALPWDVVLCDCQLPGTSFQACIDHLQRHLPEVPIILISDEIGPAAAAALLRDGVTDFVLKDRLERLSFAIERSVETATARSTLQTTEAALRESQEFVQATLDALKDHIAVLDADGVILAVNRAWSLFATENGCDAARVGAGANYLDVCDGADEDGRAVSTLIREIVAGQSEEATYEYPCHSPQTARWFLCRLTRFSEAGAIKVVVAHKDISDAKRAEAVLREREEMLLVQRNALISLTRASLDNRNDILAGLRQITETAAHTTHVGRVGIWKFVNEEKKLLCLDLFDMAANRHDDGIELAEDDCPTYFKVVLESGYVTIDDTRNDPLTRDFAGGYLEAHDIRSLLETSIHLGGAPYGLLSYEHVGTVRHWSSGDKAFALAMANLVSLALEEWERRRAEEQLRLQSSALNATSNGVMITDRDGYITWANPAFMVMSGYSLGEVIGRHPGELIDSGRHSRSFFREMWGTILGGRVWSGVIINRRKDGTEYSEAQTISPIRDATGAITHFVSIKEDVTEKLAAEEQHEAMRARLQRAVQAGKMVVWEWDTKTGMIEYATDASGKDPTLGSFEDRMARVHPEDAHVLRQLLVDCVALPGTGFQKEFRKKGEDGNYGWFYLSGVSEVVGDGSVRVIGTTMDIGDRKRLEAEYQQAQKMESVGRLAGGIAHDFNNLLGVIRGYSEFALQAMGEDSPQREDVTEIVRATERAAGLTRQLLAFSRRQILRPEVLRINDCVANLEKMLARIIGEDIEVKIALDSDAGQVLADPGQIEQVLMNLSVNARDAMPSGGRLTISTGREIIDAAQASTLPGARPGVFVCLSVQDSGIGMDKAVCDQIFEPFFTTKSVNKGTGLGLATVYGIVKQSDGNIYVESEPGVGTTFRIFLPWVDAQMEVETPETPQEALLPGTETILLIEDEEALRAVTRLILNRVGYTVLAAENGSEAMKLMEEHSATVDLILTDVVMPGESGPEIARALQAAYPSLKVLYMSGYTDDAIIHHGVLDKGVQLINKPFTFAKLTQTIRTVLDTP